MRAVAAAGEAQLLGRLTESLRHTPDLAAQMQTALLAGEGLLALAEGRADEAVEKLEAATERERGLGRTYNAACLELDLARALEAADQAEAAAEGRARAESVLGPLGCVNPF